MSRLWICGAGDLGLRVALQSRQGDWAVMLETFSSKRHASYESLGFETIDSVSALQNKQTCSHLLLSLTPGPTYLTAIQRALNRWDRSGVAVLISSTGVYSQQNGEGVDADSPVQNSDQVTAEKMALAAGAHVVRLAGLYSLESGPHRYWQKTGSSRENKNGFINLIHRDDAATAMALLLTRPDLKPRLWNLSDGTPLLRQKIADAWSDFTGAPIEFNADSDQLGKQVKVDPEWKQLGWQPRWSSFLDFVQSIK